MNEKNRIGYKGFNVNEKGELYCRDMTFKVGETYELKGEPIICERGFHFCWNINDVNNYYGLRTSVICEVEPLGEIVADTNMTKRCTNKLKVLRMLTKEEVFCISNTGKYNTGFANTGNYNTGDRNTGNRNAGYCNTGDYNTGFHNTGDYNTGSRNTGDYDTGYYNTGDYNSGDHNTGDRNTGDYNTGDYNTGDFNAGFFNTKENKCFIFDKMSDMTCIEFINSEYYRALTSAVFPLTEWIEYTTDEKANDKAKELIGGYLKNRTFKEAAQIWWSNMSEENKEIIKQIPNFTPEKFEAITGIKVEDEE